MNTAVETFGTASDRTVDAAAPFDRADEYDDLLARGVRLSGEAKPFFIDGRLADLRAQLPLTCAPDRILDFGCGTGETTAALSRLFPSSVVVGVDTAERALEAARTTHGSSRVTFHTLESHRASDRFDVCYVNGVFHHIAPAERLAAAAWIWNALEPGGVLALFENNPWNPGTRMVMKRIPFDRDARTLSVIETRRLLRTAGFRSCGGGRFLFYFPHALRALRVIEPWLVRVPFGAQYWVMAVK